MAVMGLQRQRGLSLLPIRAPIASSKIDDRIDTRVPLCSTLGKRHPLLPQQTSSVVVMPHINESEFQMDKPNSRFFPVLAAVIPILDASVSATRTSTRVSDPSALQELARMAERKNVYNPERVFRLNPRVVPGPSHRRLA